MAPEEAHWLDATIAALRGELWRVQEGKALLDQEVRLWGFRCGKGVCVVVVVVVGGGLGRLRWWKWLWC